MNLTGLPQDISQKILWVGSNYRTNSLSKKEGGTEIIIHYNDGQVLGYDRIKCMSSYTFIILQKRLNREKSEEMAKLNQIDKIRNLIKGVYIWSENSFKEVWNIDSNELPWEKLADYDNKTANHEAKPFLTDYEAYSSLNLIPTNELMYEFRVTKQPQRIGMKRAGMKTINEQFKTGTHSIEFKTETLFTRQ